MHFMYAKYAVAPGLFTTLDKVQGMHVVFFVFLH